MYSEIYYDQGGRLFQYLKQKQLVEDHESYTLKNQFLNQQQVQEDVLQKQERSYQEFYQDQTFFFIIDILWGPKLLFNYYSNNKDLNLNYLRQIIILQSILVAILLIYFPIIIKLCLIIVICLLLLFFSELKGTNILNVCEKIQSTGSGFDKKYKKTRRLIKQRHTSVQQKVRIQNDMNDQIKQLIENIKSVYQSFNIKYQKSEIQYSMKLEQGSIDLGIWFRQLQKYSFAYFLDKKSSLTQKFNLMQRLKKILRAQQQLQKFFIFIILLQNRILKVRSKKVIKQKQRILIVNPKLNNVIECIENLFTTQNILLEYIKTLRTQQNHKNKQILQKIIFQINGISKYLKSELDQLKEKQIQIQNKESRNQKGQIYEIKNLEDIKNEGEEQKNRFVYYTDEGKVQFNKDVNEIQDRLQFLLSRKRQRFIKNVENVEDKKIRFNFVNELKSKIQDRNQYLQ